MKTPWPSVLLAPLIAAVASGCTGLDLANYDACDRSSWGFKLAPRLFAIVTEQEGLEGARYAEGALWDELARRPDRPAFRALCALLNDRSRQWETVILVERLDWHTSSTPYGFLLIAVSHNGPMAVTNMRWCGNDWWQLAPNLLSLNVNHEKLQLVLRDLDGPALVLPELFIWQGVHQCPMFVFHYLRPRSNRSWCFAMHGFDLAMPTTARSFREQLDYQGVANCVRAFEQPVFFDHSTPFIGEIVVPATEGAGLDRIADPYGTLLARAWEAAFDRPDVNRYFVSVQRELRKPPAGEPQLPKPPRP